MRVNGLFVVLVMAVLLVVSACQESSVKPTPESECGLFAPTDTVWYAYTAIDSGNVIVARGTLGLLFEQFPDPPEVPEIAGAWEIELVEPGFNTGPQIGSGSLVGSWMVNDGISLSLNPDVADDNVVVNADANPCPESAFAGEWQYTTFSGHQNAGFVSIVRVPTE
jgi:hypothetical protein